MISWDSPWLNEKHNAPRIGLSVGSAASIMRSNVSGANCMSVSIHQSQSASVSSQKVRVIWFRPCATFVVPNAMEAPPPTIRP